MNAVASDGGGEHRVVVDDVESSARCVNLRKGSRLRACERGIRMLVPILDRARPARERRFDAAARAASCTSRSGVIA
jgi:hypothetical protein